MENEFAVSVFLEPVISLCYPQDENFSPINFIWIMRGMHWIAWRNYISTEPEMNIWDNQALSIMKNLALWKIKLTE